MMQTIRVILFLACASLSFAAQPKLDLTGIKQQIIEELFELKKDLQQAKVQLDSLAVNNQQIKISLNEMESWGLLQQEEKERYYAQAIEASAETETIRAQLDQEKALRAKVSSSYNRIKNILGCLFGTMLAILVFKLNNSFLGSLGASALPQLRLLGFVAPVAGFALGYLAIYLYF
jgi:uncharacterized membrane protein